jgi:hypothetical protein
VAESHPTADEDPADNSDDEQLASGDAGASVPQRQATTRRKGAQNSTVTAPPAKLRRVGTKSRVKAEPSGGDVLPPTQYSPRHGQIMEVVLNSPKVSGKGKGKGVSGKAGRVEEAEEAEEEAGSTSQQAQGAKKLVFG